MDSIKYFTKKKEQSTINGKKEFNYSSKNFHENIYNNSFRNSLSSIKMQNNFLLKKHKPTNNEDIIFNNDMNISENSTSNNQQNPIKQDSEIIIVIVRHGERADLAGTDIKFNISDPELTEKGIKQAFEAGIRLKEILDLLKPKNKKIAIISSPFSRCIMTAKYIKNGMNYNLPLFLENGLSEFINRQWFKSSPKEFLCYLNYNNLLFKEIMNEIIIDNSIKELRVFPESTSRCVERFNSTFDSIIEQYSIKTGYNVIVLVTHFFGIQCLCEKMNIPLDNFDIEYCSTFVFRFDKIKKEFKFENNFYPIDEEIY